MPGIPDTIRAVLAARIDRLPAEEKRLLQTAAGIIGTEVAVPLFQAITELPAEALHSGPEASSGSRLSLRDAPCSGVGLHLQARAHA